MQSSRLARRGRVASLHMEEEKHEILRVTERPESKIRHSRMRSRFEHDIKMDLEVKGCEFVDGVYI
jgi:hypothetical protein